MRILHVAESIRGGCGTYLNEIAPLQIATSGTHAVCVLVPRPHRTQRTSSTSESIRAFRRHNRMNGLLFPALELHRTISAFSPDVIHAHSTFAGAVSRLFAIAHPGMPPVIYCPHGWVFDVAAHDLTR